MIPHLLHWVWPHPAKMQVADEAALCSWRKHHPTWRCLVWTPEPEAVPASLHNLDFEIRELPPLVNQRLYSRLHGLIQEETEILRVLASIEIAAHHGGVCPPKSDFCNVSIEPLLKNVRLFKRELTPDNCAEPLLSQRELPLYGATPNHPALWNAVCDVESFLAQSHPAPADTISAASLVQALQFHLECHPDLVPFPGGVFETQLCSVL